MFSGRILGIGLVLLATAGAVHGAYLYPWDDNNPTVVDGPDPAPVPDPGQNILAAWHAYEGGFHYFRIDLEAKPSSGADNAAEIYGIYIDSKPGGGSNADVQYIPAGIPGVDYILDSHWASDDYYNAHHYHTWSPYLQQFNYNDPDAHQETENGGTTLEWKINDVGMGNKFTWTAADITQGSPSTTHDIVEPVYFPEPSTGVMVLVLGAWTLRRRR